MKGILRGGLLALLLGLLPAVPAVAPAAAQDVPEYHLKALLYFRLSQFVYWPPGVDVREGGVLCVVGENPFEGFLQKVSLRVGTRVLINPPVLSDCQLVFIARSERPRLSSWLRQLEILHVVSVSDIPGFASAGGMIELPLEGERVGIIINREVAQQRGLDFNAQLLRLARVIE